MKEKKIKNLIMNRAICMAAYLVAFWTGISMLYCDIFDTIQSAGLTFQEKIVSTMTVLFPLVVIIDIVFLICTRDQRKISVEVGVMVGSFVGFIAMLIVDSGTVVLTIKSILGMA